MVQGKRYGLALDVPQHLLYINKKLMKDAGFAGADGQPRVPASRDELVAMAQKLTKDDVFGLAIGTIGPGRYTWGFYNLLWQNSGNVYGPDFKRSTLAEPAAVEVAEFWGSLNTKLKIAPPGNANCRDAFVAGKLGLWLAGSWNFTGLREAKLDFAVAPVPRLFKRQVAWAGPHQYVFPKRKTADPAKRDAVLTHMRWITDNVAEWTLRPDLGLEEEPLRSPHRRRPVPEGVRRPGRQLVLRPVDSEVGDGREPRASGDREHLRRAEAGQGGDGGARPPDQRTARLARDRGGGERKTGKRVLA
jgi:hypothetical protein